MTRHADFCRWHPCERRFLDRRVTVATIDAEALDVMFMAERHGLDARHPGLGDVGERLMAASSQARAATRNTAPKMLSLEKVLVLG